MTTLSWVLLGVTLAVAVTNWVAVWQESTPVEYVAKPLTMVALAGLLLSLHLPQGETRVWHLVAVLLSLCGDVFLMIPGERDEMFLGGLTSFLLAHIAYIIGMVSLGVTSPALIVGIVVAVVAISVVGSRIAPAAKRADARLFIPVVAYMAVIGTMMATSIGTGIVLGVVGALLFCTSDSLLGWSRFVAPFPYSHPAVMVTYHLGQIGLVLALLK